MANLRKLFSTTVFLILGFNQSNVKNDLSDVALVISKVVTVFKSVVLFKFLFFFWLKKIT